MHNFAVTERDRHLVGDKQAERGGNGDCELPGQRYGLRRANENHWEDDLCASGGESVSRNCATTDDGRCLDRAEQAGRQGRQEERLPGGHGSILLLG